jgi:putative ABC transport system permease protein
MDELQEAGLSPEEARREATLQFGNFTTQMERTRDVDINTRLESMVRNFRYAARALVKTPAFTMTVVLTLALGIGANSAVFSAIYAVLLRPLPFPDADQLVTVGQSQPKVPQPFVAPVRLEDWNRLNNTFTAIAGYYAEDTSETSGDLPERLRRVWVTPRFLQVLGISPALGRDFSPQEERFGGPPAVLISSRLWHRRFGGDQSVIGKTLRAPTTAFLIVGVMPASFQFPDREVDLWSPAPADAPYAQSRELTWLSTIGRLKAEVTPAEGLANLTLVQSNLGRQYPKTDAKISVSLRSLKDVTVGRVRNSLWLLFGSVSLLLLIACTNIAALLLSRTVARQHEISVRFSLGASRSSVAAHLLTEVLILAVAGATVGLLVASGASKVFRYLAKDLPRIDEIGLNGNIVIYSLLCAVAATLLCGLFPAIRGTRRNLAVSLSRGGRSQVSGRNPLQLLLVGVQVALAVMLLTGAGLLLRSFQELGRVSSGFDPHHVLTFHVSSSYAESGGPPARQRTERILDALRLLPEVEADAVSSSLPGVPNQYQIELKTTEARAESEPKMLAQARWVTPDYFSVLRIPLIAGELCRNQIGQPAVMVNRSFAGLYLNGAGAIGRHLVQPGNPFLSAAEISGIVGDAREAGLDHEPPPTTYWCNGSMQPGTFFLVRTRGEPTSTIAAARRKIHEILPQRSVYDLTLLTDHISDAYAENRLRTVQLACFALTAIALASIGLYGTLTYLVNVRQREVALRIALGALPGQVVRQFLRQGVLVSLLGCMAGLALAEVFTRMLSSMLYGVSATDLVTLGSVVALVSTVSVIASLLPALRAARLEPVQALREE